MSESPAQPVRESVTENAVRDVVLIGASAGGIAAIGKLLSELPRDLPAALAITLHRSAKHPSLLRTIFASHSTLPVIEPERGQPFERGNVYLAPPDHHLVFGGGLVMLNRGPKENHSRPSIDVMFRSGALSYGSRVVGVVLTGNLQDGVAGLTAITQHGGLSIAQDPSEAYAPSMPQNAVTHDNVNIVFRLAAAGEVVAKLARGEGVKAALQTDGARAPQAGA